MKNGIERADNVQSGENANKRKGGTGELTKQRKKVRGDKPMRSFH